jgi:hypothetical protein
VEGAGHERREVTRSREARGYSAPIKLVG